MIGLLCYHFRIMTALTIPLLMSSLISSLGSLEPVLTGKIGFRVLAYYVGTTTLAVTEGFCLSVGIGGLIGFNNDFNDEDEDGLRKNETISAAAASENFTGVLSNFTGVLSNSTLQDVAEEKPDYKTIDTFIDMLR